jgi:hypothetical protein
VLKWLQESAVSDWVATSTWGYPLTLTTHGVGLAIVVGVILIISMRVMGLFPGIPLQVTRSLLPYMWVAFVLNLISGLALFTADAERFFFALTFQLKILFIVLGLVVVVVLDQMVLKPAVQRDGAATLPGYAKPLAIVSVLLWWFSVILSGRLIAYLA